MKKILILLFGVLLLVGCTNGESGGVNDGKDKVLSEKDVKEIFETAGLGENDKLLSVTLKDGKIAAEVELAPHELLKPEEIAVTSYSRTSDALLEGKGWEVLSVVYKEAGTITMNREQEVKNEQDKGYFPIAEINNNLK